MPYTHTLLRSLDLYFPLQVVLSLMNTDRVMAALYLSTIDSQLCFTRPYICEAKVDRTSFVFQERGELMF